MRKIFLLLLALAAPATTLAYDFNADGIQDTIIYSSTSFTIKHNRVGVADSVVSLSPGWLTVTPVDTDGLAGDDVAILYRNSIVFYHDTTKTKRSKFLSSGSGTNPWTVAFYRPVDAVGGAELVLIQSNGNQYVQYEIVHDTAAANDYYNTYRLQQGNVSVHFAELDGYPGEEIFCIENRLSGFTPSSIYHNRTRTATNQLYTSAGWGAVYFQDIAGLGRNQVAWFYPNGVPGATWFHTRTLDDRTGTYRNY